MEAPLGWLVRGWCPLTEEVTSQQPSRNTNPGGEQHSVSATGVAGAGSGKLGIRYTMFLVHLYHIDVGGQQCAAA